MAARYRILINPKSRSGGSTDLVGLAERVFAGREAEVRVPGSRDELKRLAGEAASDGFTHVVVAGGDGTINAVLDDIAGTDVTLGVVPCGTANDLASQLGLPLDPEAAFRLVLHGERRELDLITVNGHHYVTGGAIGSAVGIAAGVNAWKAARGLRRWLIRSLGSWAYLVYSGFYLALHPRLWLQVRLDGETGPKGETKLLVLLVNNQAVIGKTFKAAPFARSDDGFIEACLIEWQGRLRGIYLATLLAMGGLHVGRRGVRIWRTSCIEIAGEEPITFMGDGEMLVSDRHLVIASRPRALAVMVPIDRNRTRHLTANFGGTAMLGGASPLAGTADLGRQPDWTGE